MPWSRVSCHPSCPDRPGLTLSWLNLRRSLSQLPVKEDNRRRCSERRSEPARVEACGCAGMLMPCQGEQVTGEGAQVPGGAGPTDHGTLSSGSLLPQLPCCGLSCACPDPNCHLPFLPEVAQAQAPPDFNKRCFTEDFFYFSAASPRYPRGLFLSFRSGSSVTFSDPNVLTHNLLSCFLAWRPVCSLSPSPPLTCTFREEKRFVSFPAVAPEQCLEHSKYSIDSCLT